MYVSLFFLLSAALRPSATRLLTFFFNTLFFVPRIRIRDALVVRPCVWMTEFADRECVSRPRTFDLII